MALQYIDEELKNLEKSDRMIKFDPNFKGRGFVVDNHLVFVLSPFGDPFDEIYADQIKPTVESITGLRCMRADDIYDTKPIMEDIWESICRAAVVVSELTGRNPNVFYETGIAHTVGKEVILITQSLDDVPFDLRHLRLIEYKNTPRGATKFKTALSKTLQNVLKREKTR